MGADEEIIRSRSNSGLKHLRAVLAGRHPESLVLEGERLVRDALGAGRPLETLFVSEERRSLLEQLEQAGAHGRLVESGLLEQASGLKTAPGVIALARTPASVDLDTLDLGVDALLLVVAGVADPGNLGALARSAEAAGVKALIILPGGAGPWNAKALRGSMGSLLRLPVVTGRSPEEVATILDRRGVRQATASTRGGLPPAEFDWSGPVALWVGAETGDLPSTGCELEPITIPTAGATESLNVTVAASLILFAAGRVGVETP